jgi:hypothetical protein
MVLPPRVLLLDEPPPSGPYKVDKKNKDRIKGKKVETIPYFERKSGREPPQWPRKYIGPRRAPGEGPQVSQVRFEHDEMKRIAEEKWDARDPMLFAPEVPSF